MASALDVDLLAAALGVNEQLMRSMIDGREQAKDSPYGSHISHRMAEAGLSASWLDGNNPDITPAFLGTLRRLAANSDRKAPIRRANFKKLVKAFDGRLHILADALEVVEESIGNITSGRHELDDQRFGHFNPRLMAAGFPNGWLEDPEATLSETQINGLVTLATDDYERMFEAELSHTRGGAHVHAPEPTRPTADDEDKTEPRGQVEMTLEQETAMTEPVATHQSAGSAADTPSPSLPRGVMGAGRKLGGTLSLPPKKPAASAPAASASPTVIPSGMPVKPTQAGPATQPEAPATRSQPTPPVARMRAKEKDGLSKEQSLVRAGALEQLLSSARRGVNVTLWRDLLGPGQAYWGNVKRGAILFRDELAEGAVAYLGLPDGWLDQPSFPPATLAAWVTNKDLPLPASPEEALAAAQAARAGAASAPPAAAAPAPVQAPPAAAAENAPRAAAPSAAKPAKPVKPFARKAASPAEPAAAPAAPVAAPTPVASPAPQKEVTITVNTPAPATVTAQAQAPQAVALEATRAAEAFAWAPASDPQPIVAPGPLTQALNSVLSQLALEGKFTESDALRLLTFMLTR